MPLQFEFDTAPSAGLGPSIPLATQLAQLTGFAGAFTAGTLDLADGAKIPLWDAVAGAGSFTGLNTAFEATKATEDGVAVVRCDGTNVMTLGGLTIGNTAAYSIGARLKPQAPTVDNKTVLGQTLASPRATLSQRYVSGDGYFRLDQDTDINVDIVNDGASEWRNILICQGAGVSKISIDGSAFLTAPNATMNLPTFHLAGGRTNFAEAQVDFRNLIFVASDVSTNPVQLEIMRLAIASL